MPKKTDDNTTTSSQIKLDKNKQLKKDNGKLSHGESCFSANVWEKLKGVYKTESALMKALNAKGKSWFL